MPRPQIQVYMPIPCQEVLAPVGMRYRVLHGGRGGGKSYSFADAAIAKAAQTKTRFLCARETQTSIRESVHRLLCDRISAMGLEKYFAIRQDGIKSIFGSEFFFKGIRTNPQDIKSTEGINICWLSEAAKISKDSWEILTPTIREPGSEIWIDYNPDETDDPIHQIFAVNQPPPRSIIREVNYPDNAMFPEVLREEMEYCKRVDPEAYEHVWMGKVKGYSDALIFKGKIYVEEFDIPEDAQFYYGADFGFATDAMWMGRAYIEGRTLYISDEVYGVGIEIDELPQVWDNVPGSRKWRIRADSARPDTISYLKRKGFNISGAEKGPGSVEDGITFLRGFERIVIHPRCKGAKDNFQNYRWKQDKITKEILPVPVDKQNHAPDGIRYALEPLIKSRATIFDVLGK